MLKSRHHTSTIIRFPVATPTLIGALTLTSMAFYFARVLYFNLPVAIDSPTFQRNINFSGALTDSVLAGVWGV